MSHSMKLFTFLTRENIFRHHYLAFKYGCSYSKDITKSILPTSTISPDYLLQNLRDAASSQNVLDLVGTHYKIMNSKQLLQSLRTLFTFQKYGNSSLSTKEIIKHPHFEKLCFSLKSQAGMIELSETLEALKIISFVGVSSNSTIVQVLLQLIRHNINDLTLSNLMFLDFLLRQFKSSPLVDGLLIAIPVVFEANLPLKMDKENVSHLAEYLHFASKKNVSSRCTQLIVNNLIKAIDFSGVDCKVANSILWSICDIEPKEFALPLFKKALNTLLVEGFDKLDYQDVITTLSKISVLTTFKSSLYYDDAFYDACAHYVIDKDLGFDEAIFTLLKFARVNHTNDNLLNYASKKCNEKPELLTKGVPLLVYGAAVALAQSEYKPTYWQIMKEAIEATKCFERHEKRDIIWLKLASSLCALDIYKFEVLEEALKISNLRTLANTKGIPVDYDNFLIILQAINVFKPDHRQLLPDKETIKAMLSKIKPVVEYPLEGALQKALGGDAYVNTCMKTTLHHHIDHVVIMRKGGFPVPLKKNCQLVEDLDIPADGFLVLILALQSWHYTINTKRLKATSLLMIKTLEAKGYNVVPVCMDVWEQLPDFERIPFLMQAIKLKIVTRVEMSNAIC